jgi:hypothetical protein
MKPEIESRSLNEIRFAIYTDFRSVPAIGCCRYCLYADSHTAANLNPYRYGDNGGHHTCDHCSHPARNCGRHNGTDFCRNGSADDVRYHPGNPACDNARYISRDCRGNCAADCDE